MLTFWGDILDDTEGRIKRDVYSPLLGWSTHSPDMPCHAWSFPTLSLYLHLQIFFCSFTVEETFALKFFFNRWPLNVCSYTPSHPVPASLYAFYFFGQILFSHFSRGPTSLNSRNGPTFVETIACFLVWDAYYVAYCFIVGSVIQLMQLFSLVKHVSFLYKIYSQSRPPLQYVCYLLF